MTRDDVVRAALTALLSAVETMRTFERTLPPPARRTLDEQLRVARLAVQALGTSTKEDPHASR
ncbi:MAG: hypothetical protein KIT14_12570 [bacterium]|nr:hypothetical protein [bacterium]